MLLQCPYSTLLSAFAHRLLETVSNPTENEPSSRQERQEIQT